MDNINQNTGDQSQSNANFGQPHIPPPGAQGNSKNPTGRILIIVASVLLLFGLGFAGYTLLSSGSGAGTPEEAADNFFNALDGEDPLAVAEVILPSEFDSTVKPQQAIVSELVRLDILNKNVLKDDHISLGEFLEAEILEPLKYESEPIAGDEEIAAVNVISGKLKLTAKESKLKDLLGSRISGDSIGNEVSTLTVTFSEDSVESVDQTSGRAAKTDTSEDPFRLVSVKEDGSYYVSLWYTVAEEIRKENGSPEPDFSKKLEPKGAETPEEALKLALDRFVNGNYDDAIATMDPEEFRVIYDYWSLLEEDVNSTNESISDLVDLEFTTSSTEKNGRKIAQIETIKGTLKGTETTFFANLNPEEFVFSLENFENGNTKIDSFKFDSSTVEFYGKDLSKVPDASKIEFKMDFSGLVDKSSNMITGQGVINGAEFELEYDVESLEGNFNVDGNGQSIKYKAFIQGDCIVGLDETTGQEQNLTCEPGLTDQLKQQSEYFSSGEANNYYERFKELQTGFTVVERDGKWYVSGLPSFNYMVSDWLSILEPEDLDSFEEYYQNLESEIEQGLSFSI